MFLLWFFFHWWLIEYKWYRKWIGGHWELWYCDVTGTIIWLQMNECSKITKTRPGACFGRPCCEEYRVILTSKEDVN